jgi:hypothetical protein
MTRRRARKCWRHSVDRVPRRRPGRSGYRRSQGMALRTERGKLRRGFEVDGDWWLPATPDRKVKGKLTVSEQGKGELALIGSLRPFFEAGETATGNGVTTTEARPAPVAATAGRGPDQAAGCSGRPRPSAWQGPARRSGAPRGW